MFQRRATSSAQFDVEAEAFLQRSQHSSPAGPTRKQDAMSQVHLPGVFTDKVSIATVSVPQSALQTHCSIPEARIILPTDEVPKGMKIVQGI